MSFCNNPATRRQLHGWITQGGNGGISRAGKIYLPSVPPTNTTARAGDDTAEAVASKLPEAVSPRPSDTLPITRKSSLP